MVNKLLLLILSASLTAVVSYDWAPDLPPGPYCGGGYNQPDHCCNNRQDGCSRPILETLCYCDEFCNRTRSHDDCCPDYPQVCLGITPPPSEPLIDPCRYNNKVYLPNDKREDNCNTCICELNTATNTTSWQCSYDECLISDQVIQGVNAQYTGWRAANYTQFYGKKLKDGLVYKLGTMPLSQATRRLGPIRHDKDIPYPSTFDARDRWGQFISPVRDQGWCGSDWAVAVASVASDRFAIQSNGAESLVLSPQLLLSCNVKQQQACAGGHIDVAWNFVRNHGLVDEECFPYEAAKTKCPFRPRGTLRQDGCRIPVPQRTSRYSVGPPGKLDNEKDIMYDIMESGPVQAIMTVHQDFFHYRDGVYRHTRLGDTRLHGLHSVRIIGWGEERGQKYWLVANSWGEDWGENGYFKIARGVNESGIESFVVNVLAEVTEAYQRK